MNNFELRYEVLRNIDNLIELAVNKGFAIGIGQKDIDHLTMEIFKQKRIILKLLEINI
ncbi:hypothetical protein [Escherichia phage slur04]|uniref:Uncharacterized protein n=2 Tax=Tequatrovirus slur02 TaxID=2956502 RepID=A0A0M7Q875_9CAUD|nr:hypothetical protein AVU04_gp213 [Escherichia phage slur02]YP_009625329.1 hypothetical protein FDJ55_gp083 [Escherichia phage slur04]QXN68203.1 hypothetical protein JK1_0108 [Escherichia phage JK1]CUL02883.1 hypothetical protein [Escherichia phage slur11]CUL03669.1 hypothetical protein [Escherichia phage slur13]CUL01341.1 unnamed protein product [Escherichia phage slur02]CUL01955.1 hypothetical protein [Escherichia phage slur04]